MSTKDMTTRPSNTAASPASAADARDEPALLPPVDVIEDATGITLYADLPGVPKELRDQEIDDRELARVEGIIYSMTLAERRNPDLIKGRRKERIAKGSGTQLQEVTGLVSQFKQMQRMMKKMGGGKGGQIDPRDLMRRMR